MQSNLQMNAVFEWSQRLALCLTSILMFWCMGKESLREYAAEDAQSIKNTVYEPRVDYLKFTAASWAMKHEKFE